MSKDALYWDGYFMALAKVSALRSKDPSTKVGACIINEDKKVISLGYNGMPKGNDEFPWQREGDLAHTKYPYVIHAEMNAILNTYVPLIKGSTIYTSLYPCSNCAKTIVQAGINTVIYEDDKYHDTEDASIARSILENSGVIVRHISIDTGVEVKVGENKFSI
ncbi:dCMP deaminase family protein [Mycoplasmopsis felifaucium]|uniref:dCMP deaminase family protein n=1 Tax=Mycoplasmopsis felifaucium TaxID=35768 RepID=A0ABZ2RPR0_9BACT